MRVAAYAGASTVLALGVVLRAFHERPNFYSAAVYLGQSNACRMILLNMLLLTASASMYVLQRLFYGPLRAIEIEQLWDKAWYAITETALAMTTFRDEVGGWFFIMFICLLAGKVWGWIGEGRVDVMEQQPPANPRLFHTRLMASLLLSEAFDLLMLRYCLKTLAAQPRPGMMVMFAFEFAVLAIVSSSTTVRYTLHLQEKWVIKRQTQIKIEERREEMRSARQEAERQASDESGAEAALNAPVPEEIDENEIDVPGWQEKGRYILFLDLATDFFKLGLYLGFFTVLLLFSGIPVHMFRDLFITSRSFIKRINDYFKYRNATKDMNARYPDATAEDLERESTCIICREEMRLWQAPVQQQAAGNQQRRRSPPDERQRPKKLPCGHILHFGCLRSWLERQQVCPTCRRSVLLDNNPAMPGGQGPQNPGQAGQQPAPGQTNRNGVNANQQAQNRNGLRARTWNLGNLRLTFATGNAQQFQNAFQQYREQRNNGNPNQQPLLNNDVANALSAVQGRQENNDVGNLQDQVANVERRVMHEINNLNVAQNQLGIVRALQQELSRLREVQANPTQVSPGVNIGPVPVAHGMPAMMMPGFDPNAQAFGNHMRAVNLPNGPHVFQQIHTVQPQQAVFSNHNQSAALGPGHPNLPQDLVLPEGWSMLPLHNVGRTSQNDTDEASRQSDRDITAPIPQISVNVDQTQHQASQPEMEAQSTDTTNAIDTSNLPDQNAREPTEITAPTSTPQEDASTSPSSIRESSAPPDWSAEAVTHPVETTNTGHHREDSAQHESMSNVENAVEEANGSTHTGKGKGRAVSVEEVEDDQS
ncbi:MAG: E3 ubiquitin-protein ligase hrd1 [Chrysothrix sp. TS-e1954]|nr:MAG: E3 ubiquitin-protein ligase hrd1 [Chrysothrix sp. TS-e1954]